MHKAVAAQVWYLSNLEGQLPYCLTLRTIRTVTVIGSEGGYGRQRP